MTVVSGFGRLITIRTLESAVTSLLTDMHKESESNTITGAAAGGPRLLVFLTSWAARAAQLCGSATIHVPYE